LLSRLHIGILGCRLDVVKAQTRGPQRVHAGAGAGQERRQVHHDRVGDGAALVHPEDRQRQNAAELIRAGLNRRYGASSSRRISAFVS